MSLGEKLGEQYTCLQTVVGWRVRVLPSLIVPRRKCSCNFSAEELEIS